MNSTEKLALASHLIKQADILSDAKSKLTEGLGYLKGKAQQAGSAVTEKLKGYKPFNQNDALLGGLAAGAAGGLGGAALGKLRNMLRPEDEQEDKSDVMTYALLGAAAAGIPTAMLPQLIANNPMGNKVLNELYLLGLSKGGFGTEALGEQATKGIRAGLGYMPHAMKAAPVQSATLGNILSALKR